jgi:hypothetical protein
MRVALAVLASLTVAGCQDSDRFDLACKNREPKFGDLNMSLDLRAMRYCTKNEAGLCTFSFVRNIVSIEPDKIELRRAGEVVPESLAVDRDTGVLTDTIGQRVVFTYDCTKKPFTSLPERKF